VVSIIAAKEGGAQESNGAQCRLEINRDNAMDGPLGAGTIYRGCCSFGKSGQTAGNKTKHMRWINIPILCPYF